MTEDEEEAEGPRKVRREGAKGQGEKRGEQAGARGTRGMAGRPDRRGWVVQNISVHIQRSWVSVRCETHATARVADFSPSFWPPPIDTGDLFWIIFSGQSGAAPLPRPPPRSLAPSPFWSPPSLPPAI